jgi:hypothetical protein
VYHFLDFVGAQFVSYFIHFFRFLLKLRETDRFARDMETFVYPSFSEGVLFDGTIDHESLQPLLVVLGPRDPSLGGYDLNDEMVDEEGNTSG